MELRGFHHGATEGTEPTENSLRGRVFLGVPGVLAVKAFPDALRTTERRNDGKPRRTRRNTRGTKVTKELPRIPESYSGGFEEMTAHRGTALSPGECR